MSTHYKVDMKIGDNRLIASTYIIEDLHKIIATFINAAAAYELSKLESKLKASLKKLKAIDSRV